jgi:hypothetical protein
MDEGTAGERHGMCESGFKTTGEWHGIGMVGVNPPLYNSSPEETEHFHSNKN